MIPNACQQAQPKAMEVEEVQKDLDAMSKEEQRAAVMADAPELAALLADLQLSLAEVRGRVGPLLREARPPPLRHTLHSGVLYTGCNKSRSNLLTRTRSSDKVSC
jgi:hypothetical protein